MNLIKIGVFLMSIFSHCTYAKLPFKAFAEPYIEKSVTSSSQKIGNISSQTGDASAFSIGSRLGLESLIGLIGGIGFDYTSAIVTNAISSNSSYDLSFQSIDAFIGFKFLDVYRLSYSRSISGKSTANDGANRDVNFSSNKISFGVLLNQKAYLEISRAEKYSELASTNVSVASRADLYDTYSIGVTYPIELY